VVSCCTNKIRISVTHTFFSGVIVRISYCFSRRNSDGTLYCIVIIGIERILLGLLVFKSASAPTESHAKKKYIPDLGLGVLALIFASIALISPATVMEIPAVLLSISISVMFNGFGRLFQGAMAKGQGRVFRLVSLGLGALSVGAAIFVSNSHIFGIIFPVRVLLVVLLIHGLAMTLFGIFGRLSLEQVLRNRGMK